MRTPITLLLALAATGCAGAYRDPQAYWGRPGSALPELAAEAEACYQAAIEAESPAALAVTAGAPRLLPRTEPPPRLWARAPHETALERFDEQLRYERCMRDRGWRPARAVPPAPVRLRRGRTAPAGGRGRGSPSGSGGARLPRGAGRGGTSR